MFPSGNAVSADPVSSDPIFSTLVFFVFCPYSVPVFEKPQIVSY